MNPSPSFLPPKSSQLWVQAVGRSLSQVGSGLLFFYIPIVFVNQVGLSAATVGLSLGLSSLAGVAGHFIGGALVDSPQYGRKITLSFSAVLGMLSSFILAATHEVQLLIIATLLLGLSVGFYWTAADAAVMDVTQAAERHQAFALLSVAENLGVGIGVLGGGVLMTFIHQDYRTLFLVCGLIFLAFLMLIQARLHETRHDPVGRASDTAAGLWLAMRDQSLIIFVLANVLFTTYIALVTSTIPLYFTNFIPAMGINPDASLTNTANLFTWCYVGVGAVLQLPIARLLSPFARVRVLMIAMLLWAVGFSLVWVTGTITHFQFLWGIVALCMLAMATVVYKPFAAAIVSELAPPSLRGAYVAVSSQCWAIGYFIGPLLGGWAMDQTAAIAHKPWIFAAISTSAGLLFLHLFQRSVGTSRTSLVEESGN
jgi:MFS family permease